MLTLHIRIELTIKEIGMLVAAGKLAIVALQQWPW